MPSEMPPVDPGFGWRWDNSYARLPEGFHSRVDPTAVSTPGWGLFNRPLAESLGIQAESLDRHDHAHYFTGNRLFEGSQPIAQA